MSIVNICRGVRAGVCAGLVAVAFAVAAVGCATTSSGSSGEAQKASEANDYYPLSPGWKWAYEVQEDGAHASGITFRSVVERTLDTVILDTGGEQKLLSVTREGIAQKEGARHGDFFLKNPIALGNEWSVTGGRARIAAVGQTVTVPAGTYGGCVVVETLRSEPSRVERTAFAPGIGPVSIDVEIQDQGRFVPALRARLRGVTKPGSDPLATGP